MALGTTVCKYEDFLTDWYRAASEALQQEPVGYDALRPERILHRKYWEFNAITAALEARGLLAPGKKGCGFAVGKETLPSLFASRGVEILATDLPTDAVHSDTLKASAWADGNQHTTSKEGLHYLNLVSKIEFDRLVRFRPVDMRDLRLPWDETFDFVWSSCSIEHLGSLNAGMNFVKESLALVKPGGFALHTTEINVSSNDETLASGPCVIYRKKDIEQLGYELRKIRCAIVKPDFFMGDCIQDLEYDNDAFNAPNPKLHIKLNIAGHIATSFLIVIQKGL